MEVVWTLYLQGFMRSRWSRISFIELCGNPVTCPVEIRTPNSSNLWQLGGFPYNSQSDPASDAIIIHPDAVGHSSEKLSRIFLIWLWSNTVLNASQGVEWHQGQERWWRGCLDCVFLGQLKSQHISAEAGLMFIDRNSKLKFKVHLSHFDLQWTMW